MDDQKYIPNINPFAPKPSVLLADALALLGPNGENWIKRVEKRTVRPWWSLGLYKLHSFCAIGAIHEVNTDNAKFAAMYLSLAIPNAYSLGGSITSYNDNPLRTFPEIKVWFNSAIVAAEANGHQIDSVPLGPLGGHHAP